jgi:riboflavin kinase/FMN adenylyltransferase
VTGVEVFTDPATCLVPSQGTVVTIGVYDGVHLGHRALLRDVQRLADARSCPVAVVTFDRHPASVVRPEHAPKLLTDVEQKLELLGDAGADIALVLTFDLERAAEPAEEFVNEILVGCLHARAVVVGHDFHFGHDRGGNVDLLQRMGREAGFDVLGVTLTDDVQDQEVISSTRVRRLLAGGEVEEAARLLGRPHEVRGRVEHGDERGRELGFPTANVAVPDEVQLPGDGIYAGWYERPDGTTHAAAISLGRRPTFYEAQHWSLLEAYLLDFDGDLYDEPARVQFVRKLRDERRFDSVDALVVQMRADVDDARQALT